MFASIALVEVMVTFVALLLTILYFRNNKSRHNLPPGPRGLPFIGNLLQLGKAPQTTMLKWAEEYGPIFRIKIGNLETIYLNDHKIIRELFQETHSAGRTPNPAFLALSDGNYGLIMAEGEAWEAQRRFTLRKLRDFGFAKSSMEGLIMEEVNGMIQWFEKRLDKPIFGNRIFNGAVVNSLWKIISGERNEWDTAEQPEMLKTAQEVIDASNYLSETGLSYAPFLRFIAPKYFGWTRWIKSCQDMLLTTDRSVQRHKEELDADSPHDFIDHYLSEINHTKDRRSSFYKENGAKNLKAVIPDLFLAGSETTSHTLSWAMLFLAQHQSVQKKLHDELDSLIGEDRQPSLSDRRRLSYTEAVIMEVLRVSTIATNGVPHRMLQDAVVNGYLFPKNSVVIGHAYRVHHDPNVWGDPENFRPERFLSPDGSKVVKHEALIPFSIGKRQCIGESLARDTLFLMLAGILQKLHVRMDRNDTGDALRNLEPKTKFLNDPEPFKIIVSARESNELI